MRWIADVGASSDILGVVDVEQCSSSSLTTLVTFEASTKTGRWTTWLNGVDG